MNELAEWLTYKVCDALTGGGVVIVPMFALGAYGFYLLLQAATRPETYSSQLILSGMDALIGSVTAGNGIEPHHAAAPIVRIVSETLSGGTAVEVRQETSVRILLECRLSLLFYRTLRHLAIIRVLATAAPLLGLLGTVSGMIHTFVAMHRFGFGNSGLLAGGIAEALTATQYGLALAILLLLIGNFQEGRILRIKHDVELRIAKLLRCVYGRDPSNG